MTAIAKKVFSATLLMARGTATVVGLAVILALVVGVASTALGANGGNLVLGQNNVATALTKLTANVNGSTLQIANNNPGADDSALTLSVPDGEAPMVVSSDAKVKRLNVEQLDGKDSTAFVPTNVYDAFDTAQGIGGNSVTSLTARCDPGDLAVSGGGLSTEINSDFLASSFPNGLGARNVAIRDVGDASSMIGKVNCADLPPLHVEN